MQCKAYNDDAVVVDSAVNDVKGLVLKEVDEDSVDVDCDRNTLMPAEWKASNDDGALVRCILTNKSVCEDVYVDDEVVVENHLKDTEDGQVVVRCLDVKTQLLDLDAPHTDDVLQ